MNAHARAQALGSKLDPLARPDNRTLLRFLACGSVDHGKSTLIGRLLYESQQVFEDQLDALMADSRKFGSRDDEIDFSLLVDGLAAEREQKITIDLAYRFFATGRRKFIVIDAPGHEQYTANMATGASLADLAVVLVGADEGLTRQTRRHFLILAMLGLRNVVLAVNKMDRVSWAEAPFRAIEAQFKEIAADFGISEVVAIPLAAKSGDNVLSRSPHMNWYRGPALLEHLERVEPVRPPHDRPFRMPIQWVNRPDPNFRGYSGLIASGEVHAGMPVRILPSGRTTRISRIVTFDGDLAAASAGRAVTLAFTDHVDASRGDMVAAVEQPPATTDRFSARLFWMNSEPLVPGRRYLLKLATATVSATLEPEIQALDLDTRRLTAAPAIAENEIGVGTLKLERPIAADRYEDCKDTGGFILIDPESYDTVGMGCVAQVLTPRPAVAAPKVAAGARPRLVARSAETHARSLAKAVTWRATVGVGTFLVAFVLTGSGKLAGSVAVAEVLAKIAAYYGHERAWSWISWGKR